MRWMLALLLTLAAAVAPDATLALAQPESAVTASPDEIAQGDPEIPNIALVFNVGAGYEPATQILDVLAEQRLRSTFFVMGWWADRHPAVLKQIADGGHEIASHGHSIFDLTQASPAQVRADLLAADASIAAVTGKSTLPLWSPSAGYRNASVRQIAADIGYRPIMWTADSLDWTTDASAESVYSRIVNCARNGAIIVLHFDSPTTTNSTAQVLFAAIDALRGAGYRLTTVSELVAASPTGIRSTSTGCPPGSM